MAAPKKTVGELNGVNAALFKINMFLIPLIAGAFITWGVWVTANVWDFRGFMKYGKRFSIEDGTKLEKRIIDRVHAEFEQKS